MNKVTSVSVVFLVSFVLIFCFGYFLESNTAKHLYASSFARYRAVDTDTENAEFVAGSRYMVDGIDELIRLDEDLIREEAAFLVGDDPQDEDNVEDDYSQYSDESPRETPLDSLEARVKEWQTVHSSNQTSLPLENGSPSQKSSIKDQIYLPGPPTFVKTKLDDRKKGNDDSAIKTKYGALYRESARTTFHKKPKSHNWRNLPKEFYDLAPFIFDTVPKDFIPEFRNPCWYAPNKQLLCLPYFYLLGFPKCGTTDLWDKINNHPQVSKTRHKETHFWRDHKVGSSTAFYKYLSNALFLSRSLRSGQTDVVYGDGSATTVITQCRFIPSFPNVSNMYTNVDIIKELTPRAKFIIGIREPVERLYSGYLYHPIPDARSPQAFHSEVQKYISDFNKCLQRGDEELKCIFEKRPENGRSQRLKVGIYKPYIQAWIDGFGRDQVMVIRLEDWKVNCTSILPKIYDFLGLDALSRKVIWDLCQAKAKNVNKRPYISIGDMLPTTKELLEEFYAPYNEQLAEYLNISVYHAKP